MKKTSIKKHVLLGFVSALLMAGTASADTESFTYTLPTTSLNATLNQPFTLSGFDPSLGTLTGVSLSLNLTTEASPAIINISGQPGSYKNAFTDFTTTLTGPDGSTVSFETDSTLDTGSVGATPTQTVLTGSPVVSSTTIPVSSANFATYVTANPVSFDLMAPTSPGQTSGGTVTAGSLLFGGSSSVGGTATVEYTFDASAVPEPPTYYLIIGGAALVGVLRLRANRA